MNEELVALISELREPPLRHLDWRDFDEPAPQVPDGPFGVVTVLCFVAAVMLIAVMI